MEIKKDSDKNRRPLICVSLLFLVLLSSGCVSPDARLDLREVNDSELSELTSEDFSRLEPDIQSIFLENNTMTTATLPYDVDDKGEPVVYKGNYYRIDGEVVDTVRRVRVEFIAKKVESSNKSSVVFSEKDMEIYRKAVRFSNLTDYEAEDVVFGADYTPEEYSNSEIVHHDKISINEDDNNLVLEKHDISNVSREVYNYSLTKVANSTKDWTDQLKEKYLTTLHPSNHSNEFLMNATDSYYGEETPEFVKTVKILKDRKAYSLEDYGGKWIAEYKNKTYWIEASWSDLEVESPEDQISSNESEEYSSNDSILSSVLPAMIDPFSIISWLIGA